MSYPAKISEEQSQQMLQLRLSGESYQNIAQIFGVSKSAVIKKIAHEEKRIKAKEESLDQASDKIVNEKILSFLNQMQEISKDVADNAKTGATISSLSLSIIKEIMACADVKDLNDLKIRSRLIETFSRIANSSIATALVILKDDDVSKNLSENLAHFKKIHLNHEDIKKAIGYDFKQQIFDR